MQNTSKLWQEKLNNIARVDIISTEEKIEQWNYHKTSDIDSIKFKYRVIAFQKLKMSANN